MSQLVDSRSRSVVRMLQVAGAAGVVFAMVGCSISDSISDSVSSPFKWSSDSSKSSSHDKESYQRDIRDYTEAYVRSSEDVQGFRKGLGSIAEKHGISNWEADAATYKGIGQGLGRAKVKQAQLEVYKANIASGNSTYASAMQDGYDQYRD